ncbi:InlB B-repeat-containing protein [Desulfobacterales bacterium HSG16]|nr:InlB B-repeat-containing protein [Desulfobacterales bacterium HSG16]
MKHLIQWSIFTAIFLTASISFPAQRQAPTFPDNTNATINLSIQPENAGKITSDISELDCPGSCSKLLELSTLVELHAYFNSGYEFSHWEKIATQDSTDVEFILTSDINITLTKDIYVTAVFVPITDPQLLTVSVSPANSGVVYTWQGSIYCPDNCEENFPKNSQVTVETIYNSGFEFDHWEGAASGSESAYTVTMDTGRHVTAVFIPLKNPKKLTVSISPERSGSVSTYPGAIYCPEICSEEFPENAEISLTPEFQPGFEFDHWEGDIEGTSKNPAIIMNADKNVTAVFMPIQNPKIFNITITPEGAGSVHTQPPGIKCPGDCSEEYPMQTLVGINAVFNTGYEFDHWDYEFDHWDGGAESENSANSIIMNADKNLIAIFKTTVEPQKMTVTIEPEGAGSVYSYPGDINCPDKQCLNEFPKSSEIYLTASFMPGYEFDHWDGDASGTGHETKLLMDSPKSVTAVFKKVETPQTLTVAIEPEGAGSIHSYPGDITCPSSKCTSEFPESSEIILTADFMSGYEFDHWGGDASGSANQTVLIMDSPKSVTAVFKKMEMPQKLTVTIEPEGAGSIHSYPGDIKCPSNKCESEFPESSKVMLTADFKQGYEFDHWGGDASGSTNEITLLIDSSKSVIAVFKKMESPNTLTVSVEPADSGSVHSYPGEIACPGRCSEEFPENSKVSLTATPKPGYEFDRWGQDASSTTISTEISISSAKNVKAIFKPVEEPKTLTVEIWPDKKAGTVHSWPAGVECPGICSSTFARSASIEVIASPSPGYQFDRWEGDSSDTGPKTILKMDDAKYVKAVFSKIGASYLMTVDVLPKGAGCINSWPAGIDCSNTSNEFALNETINLTATHFEEYEFDHWEGDASGTGPGATIKMDGPKNIIAVFTPISNPQKLTVSVYPPEAGYVTSWPETISCPDNKCSGSFSLNESVSLTAKSLPGYSFDHWEGDASSSTSESAAIIMDGDKTAKAVFIEIRVEMNPPDESVISEDRVTLTINSWSGSEGRGSEYRHIATHWRIRGWENVYNAPEYNASFTSTGTAGSELTQHVVTDLKTGFKYVWKAGYKLSSGSIFWTHESNFKVGTSVTAPLIRIDSGTDGQTLKMVSFTHWPDNPDSKSIFGSIVKDKYGDDFRIGTYNPEKYGYDEYGSGLKIIPGWGCWFLARNGMDIVIEGVQVYNGDDDIYVPTRYSASNLDGWNMIGSPNAFDYDWEKIKIVVYDSAGNIVSEPKKIGDFAKNNSYIEKQIFRWENSDYESATSWIIRQNEAYFIKVKMNNVYLVFSPDARSTEVNTPRSSMKRQEMTSDNSYLAPPAPPTGLSTDKIDGTAGCFINTAVNR